ncbi:CBS domain-containing protein [Arachidicoccus soli]|uniref:CBS domain-containing protein n=1 Tax=Arachidicoccus soli TaxID=2341117 RepID=A0A386HKZ6_9BACT|nr:CBS domain-containing protein [Arachidicoccus soli]AYD46413.1 CBS domain-containing protein [Arachidicoccus soli]
MKTVHSIMEKKPEVVFSVTASTSVYDALQLMMDKNISALLIMQGSELQGIFTERDYARKIILKGKASKTTTIDEVMTKNPIVVASSEQVDRCMQIMTDMHIRHLPVSEKGTVIGMISIGDILKHLIEDQKNTIDHLQNYISS